jgi:hypothetical protein
MNPDKAKNKTEPAEKKQDYVRASYSLKRKIVDQASILPKGSKTSQVQRGKGDYP